jgi:hypothetical protein
MSPINDHHRKAKHVSFPESSVVDPDLYVLGLADPDLDPLVRSTDPEPPIKKKRKKTLDFYCFVTSL